MIISVITVCLNSRGTIREAVDSVLKQTWKDIEFIVIDGGSTDGTIDILREYKNKISYFISEPDEGIYDAMNKGLAVATGDIIYFLNSDDRFYDNNVISDVVKNLNENPSVDMLFGNVVYDYGTRSEIRDFSYINKDNILFEDLCHQAVFARKRLFRQIGNFDLKYRIVADYDWLLKVFFSHFHVRHVDRIIARFRIGGRHFVDLTFASEERLRVKLKYKSIGQYKIGEVIYRFKRKFKKLRKAKKLKPVDGKIALVTYPPDYSGVTQYSLRLFLSLQKAGENIVLVCNKMVKGVEGDGIFVFKLLGRTRTLPISIARLILFVLTENISVIHFEDHFKYPWITLLLMRYFKMKGIKVIFTAHDVISNNPKWYDPYIMKLLYNSVDGVIVHSKSSENELMELGVHPKNISIIPHGIFDQFLKGKLLEKKKAREILGVPLKRKILLFFGSIVSRKGAEPLLQEMPKLISQCSEVFLIMAGHNCYPNGYLENIVRNLGIENSVKIFGERIPENKVHVYFSACDAVILPYIECSTSGVLKVAFAFKKPVISTRVGELPELIARNKAGELVHLPFVKKDIEKIISVLANPNAYYSDQRDKNLMKEYSWDSIAEMTKKFYEFVLYQDKVL